MTRDSVAALRGAMDAATAAHALSRMEDQHQRKKPKLGAGRRSRSRVDAGGLSGDDDGLESAGGGESARPASEGPSYGLDCMGLTFVRPDGSACLLEVTGTGAPMGTEHGGGGGSEAAGQWGHRLNFVCSARPRASGSVATSSR